MDLEQYEQLKSIIKQANPNFHKRLMQVNQGVGVEITVRDENIRLTDVLLALVSNGLIAKVDCYGVITVSFKSNCIWNLKDDNLDHQSDECKKFLINLLVK